MDNIEKLYEILELKSHMHPDRIAITSIYHDNGLIKTKSCLYSELDQLSNSIAIFLRGLSCTSPPQIYITGMSDIKSAASFWGAMKAGYAPCIVTSKQLEEQLNVKQSEQHDVERLVIIDSNYPPQHLLSQITDSYKLLDYNELINNLQSYDGLSDRNEGLAYRVHTCSRSGVGQYLSIENEEIIRWLRYSAEQYNFVEQINSLFWMPLVESVGLFYGLLLPIFTGGSTVRVTPEILINYPKEILIALSTHHITNSGGSIEGLQLSLNSMSDADKIIDLCALQRIIIVGEYAKSADITKLVNRLKILNYKGDVQNVYSTDVSPAGVLNVNCSYDEYNHKTLSNNREYILIDPKTRNICSNDGIGELYVHRDLISKYYYDKTNRLQSKFDISQDRYINTGECLLLKNGTFEILAGSADTKEEKTCETVCDLHKLDTDLQKNRNETKCKVEESDNDAVIIGISTIFPMSRNHHELWSHLEQGHFLISEIPKDRWDWKSINGKPDNKSHVTDIHWGGFVSSMDKFDAEFFGISSKEASFMDPMHRKLIECVWSCFEDAGIKISDMAGRRVGVFVGISTFDYMQLTTKYNQFIHAYAGIGTLHCIAPNRISYLFDFSGPSEAIDTACSSSLVAIHRAVRSLRENECDMAIVCGANAILSDSVYVPLSNSNMLSKRGKCCTFDREADGYVRGEGIAALMIVKRVLANKNNNSIYAVIKGTSVNHCGHTDSLTAPNPIMQSECIKAALHDANLTTRDISYIEAHGTATKLGDPIEIEGLKSVFYDSIKSSEKSYENQKCIIGSVKTNIGHLEAAAGISGLIKAVLSIKYKRIPAHINYSNLNENIVLDETPFEIPMETLDWCPLDEYGRPALRAAGISSFGFGGVNSHVIIQEDVSTIPTKTRAMSYPDYIFLISAKKVDELDSYVKKYVEFLLENSLEITEQDLQYVLTTGRENFGYKLAVVFTDIKDLERKLVDYLADSNQALEYYSLTLFRGYSDQESENCISMLQDKAFDSSLELALSQHDLKVLAQLWVLGVNIDWNILQDKEIGIKRISLPTYPFSENRYWLATDDSTRHNCKSADSGELFEMRWDVATDQDIETSISKDISIIIIPDTNGYFKGLLKVAKDIGVHAISLDVPREITLDSARHQCRTNAMRDSLIKVLSQLQDNKDLTGVRILDLSPLNIVKTKPLEIEKIACNIDSLIQNILVFIKFVESQKKFIDITLSVVCHGAQGINAIKPELSYAPLWGLCKTAVLEHPEIFGRIIDIDDLESELTAKKVIAEILSPPGEYELAYRHDKRYVRRLHEIELSSEDISFSGEGTYLITGGLGSLGLMVAEWLADKGVQRILLLSRNPLPADSNAENFMIKRRRLDGLKKKSVDVVVLQADVTKLDELKAVCMEYIESGELKGIFHLAGTYTQYKINQMNLENFKNVTDPKIIGTLNLQYLVENYELEQFVLFSSAVSVWGAATGAHYGAGNAFLDSFALYYGSKSTAVKSINWGGLWEDSGIIPEGHMAHFRAIGIKMTSPNNGLRQLGSILQHNRVNTVVAPVDWQRFIPVMSAYRPNKLFEHVEASSTRQNSGVRSDIRSMISELPRDERLNMIKKYVETIIKQTLGVREGEILPQDKGFYDLGMDSLTSIDLKNKLDTNFDFSISTTELFDYNTIHSLSSFIMEKLDISLLEPETEGGPGDKRVEIEKEADGTIGANAELAGSEVDEEGYSQLVDMSEEQLLKLLETELEELSQ